MYNKNKENKVIEVFRQNIFQKAKEKFNKPYLKYNKNMITIMN